MLLFASIFVTFLFCYYTTSEWILYFVINDKKKQLNWKEEKHEDVKKKESVLMSLLLISDVKVCMFPVCVSVFLCLCVFLNLSFGMLNLPFYLTFIWIVRQCTRKIKPQKRLYFLFRWVFSFFFFFKKMLIIKT